MSGVVLAHWDAYEWAYRCAEGEANPLREVILPEFQEGGIEGAVLAIGGDSAEHCAGHDDPLVGAFVFHDRVLAEIEGALSEVTVVRSSGDLRVARSAGRVWVLFCLEGCKPLRGQMAVLHAFYRLGVRCVGLSWNGRNEAADGVGVLSPGGLTEFGRELVAEMNRLGILIDVSHLASRGLEDVLRFSNAPVCATHSNARALVDHPRNLSDEQIRAIGAAGGMVGVNFIPAFLAQDGASVEHIVRHVHHIASLIGIDRVVVGPDFTYDPWRQALRGRRSYQGVRLTIDRPYPIHRPRELGLLASALRDSGLSQSEAAGVLGENFVRLLSQVLPAGPDGRPVA